MSEKEGHGGGFFSWYSLVKASIRKAIINRKFWMVILMSLFLSGVMGYAATQEPHGLNEGSDFFDLLVISFFLPLINMIFGSSLISDEIEDKSITQVLISPLSRTKLYLGYYISLIIVSIIAMWLILTSGFLTYFGIVGLDSEALQLYLNIGSLVVIGSVVYSSLFIFVSILLKKSLYFGLFYVFIWEGFVGSLEGKIKLVSIRHYLRSIGAEIIDHGSIGGYIDASGINSSFRTLSILVIILIIAGIILFRKKEFP
ncbi:MAG: ABC transporter permease subunit [Candidatus Saliniplasma sp.]